MATSLYENTSVTIRKFKDTMYWSIDCQPVGQRLPVFSKNNEKGIGIIETLIDGYDIGKITVMKLNRKARRAIASTVKHDFESIDGGHRKRNLWDYLNNKFKVKGSFFSDLPIEEQNTFLDIELSFAIYNELDSETKGHIFRTLNKTTDVNFIEMLNSYGDTPIANFVRETVRSVSGIENEFHDLFKFNLSADEKKANYSYLSFDNNRLMQDHFLARLVHRYLVHPTGLLGGSHDKELKDMYEDSNIDNKAISKIADNVYDHCEFLRKIAVYRKPRFNGKGLSQHDAKVLSYLYFYLQDTYDNFRIDNYEDFFLAYNRANQALKNQEGPFKKELVPGNSGYNVPTMYTKYIAAPWDTKKVTRAITYLIREMPDLESLITIRDPRRNFSIVDREAKLSEQNFKCAIDGRKLNMQDAHAAHIVAHTNGGLTVYSNLAMVRAEYNKEMGSMDLNEYKASLLNNAA